MRRIEVILIAVASSVLSSILITGAIAVANYKAVPDTVPRQIPYRGNLDLDGEPYNGSLDMSFSLYRSSSGGEAAWTETQSVTVYGGRFSALLGSSSSQSVEALTGIVTAGDDLYLEVSLDGNVLMGRQRFFPAPFALWTTTSTDFNVDHDMVVGNNLSVNGNVTMNGTGFSFGGHAGRGDGGRALVHDHDDTLVINYSGDFSGGVKIGGPIVGSEHNDFNSITPLHLKTGNQHMKMDGNEIDSYSDSGEGAELWLNSNSQARVNTGGNFRVDTNAEVGNNLNVDMNATVGHDLNVGGRLYFSKRNCRDGCGEIHVMNVDGGREFGSWGSYTFCVEGYYVCGLQQKTDWCSDCDDTGVADTAIICCPF